MGKKLKWSKVLEHMWLVQFENYEKLKEDLGCASYYELEAKVKNCQEESYYKRFKILEQYKDVFFEAMDATFTKDEQEIFVENMNRIYNGC
jgi:HEPN domain-containing protein